MKCARINYVFPIRGRRRNGQTSAPPERAVARARVRARACAEHSPPPLRTRDTQDKGGGNQPGNVPVDYPPLSLLV